jgi:SPP1 family predicted phage head-tail adaptor
MSLEAGKLRHRVLIQQDAGNTTDEHGQPIQVWQDVATRWAAVEPLQGREVWQAQQARPEVTHRITLRAGGLTLTTKMRVIFEARTFEIQSVIDRGERGAELELICKETS